MLTEKDYCDYDTCVALKELGYNRGAYAYYFPNHKEDLIFNTHPMRGCSINEMLRGYNTYSDDTLGHELIDAPTMWEAQKWLREEKQMLVIPLIFADNLIDECGKIVGRWKYYSFAIYSTSTAEFIRNYDQGEECDSYEEALLEGVRASIKLLKEEK